jgi:hypothetical protein
MRRLIKGLLILAATGVLAIGALGGLLTFLFGPEVWTLGDRIDEREAFLSQQSEDYFAALAFRTAHLMDQVSEEEGALRRMTYDDMGLGTPIPENFKSLRPQGIVVYRDSAIIYLEKIMDSGAVLFVQRHGETIEIKGEFGSMGSPHMRFETYFNDKVPSSSTDEIAGKAK